MTNEQPEIQLISNIVVRDPEGQVLLVKYDPSDDRWWLPGNALVPYQHPDSRAKELLDEIAGLAFDDLKLVFIESFRGRSGWHVMFNYSATGSGTPEGDVQWFAMDDLPRTMHGKWERSVIERIMNS